MSRSKSTDLLDQALRAERLGRFQEARDLLRQAVSAVEDPLTLDARLRLGKLLIQAGPPHREEAQAVLSAARALAEQRGLPRQAAGAIHLMALLARNHGQLDEALGLLAESPAARLQEQPNPATGQLLQYQGLVEADRGELDRAERLLCLAHKAYREAHHDPGVAEVCDSLANLLLKRGKSRAALNFALMSLALKRKRSDRYGEGISLGTVGRAHVLQAQYAEAAEAFRQDLEIARELGDERGIGIMLNSLGEVALLQRNLAAAADYYQNNLGGDRGPYNMIHAQLGLARVHLAADRTDDAATCCDRVESLLEQNPKIHGLTDLLNGVRGAIARRQGDAETGERLLSQAIESLVRRNQAIDTIPLLYELRDLHQSLGRTARAVEVMARALDLLSECGSEQGVEDVERWLRTVDSPGLIRLALERHFPPWLVQDILSGHLRQPPTRKQEITVLFSDVRGYTSLTEGLAPEQVVELLNEWFEEATRAIRRHGGIVDKFIGDAVMALFGVPEPRDDAAACAVAAALEMRNALAALNLRQSVRGGLEIRVGIGIDTGEAVVGYFGSHLRRSYTAIGDSVNTASRLESATKDFPGCDILISQRTEQTLRGAGTAELTFLGHAELKGKEQKVPVYQVLGPSQPKDGKGE
jgi:class 3 adenylate cyclase